MTMKKILCLCMALVLALGCTAALAEEDLQAQLDAANAKIAELQAQVDAYYPYYFAQIVATYGEDGIIWLKDAQAEYDAMAAQYAGYGIDLESMGMADTAKKNILEAAVEDAVILAKAAELGLDQFTEEELAEFETSAQEALDHYTDYYLSYYYADAEEITDEMRAEAEAYWTDNGVTIESIIEDYKTSDIYAAVEEYVTKDVAITEEDTQAAYEELILENQENYTDDSSYNADRSSGVAIAWNPEGYRAVKHVLVKFNDEQAALYSDLQSQLDSLNAEKEAIENPAEETEEPEEPEETEETEETEQDGEEAAPSRTIEEVNADIAACATEMEALYSQLLPTAEEVIAKFIDGASFDELIAEYNEDPGMTSEPTASQGYAVREGSTYWDPAFTEGAMSIEEVGGISAPVYGKYGIHVIYYMGDVPAGEVALEDIREGVEAKALESKLQQTYDDQVAAWKDEMNVQYNYANFGIAE